MGGYSWSGLEELYGRARRDAVGAWDGLQGKAVTMLENWILNHMDVGDLTHQDLDEIALEAFEEATRRMWQIPTWLEAWEYSRKSALRMILQRMKSTRIVNVCSSSPFYGEELVDPSSSRAFREVDSFDALEAFLNKLDEETVEFIFRLLDAILSGPATLTEIAQRLGMSRSSLKRRIKEAKFLAQKKFRQ